MTYPELKQSIPDNTVIMACKKGEDVIFAHVLKLPDKDLTEDLFKLTLEGYLTELLASLKINKI